MGALVTLLLCDHLEMFHECREAWDEVDAVNAVVEAQAQPGNVEAVDEPDMFYECGSEGFIDHGAETVVKESLREGFEIGDTYFEDSLDPGLSSLDLVVDDLYYLLQSHGKFTGASWF